MNDNAMNPTGFIVHLDQLIPMSSFAPAPDQSQVILAVIDDIPKVLFWLEGRWEDEPGNVIELHTISRWVYLQL